MALWIVVPPPPSLQRTQISGSRALPREREEKAILVGPVPCANSTPLLPAVVPRSSWNFVGVRTVYAQKKLGCMMDTEFSGACLVPGGWLLDPLAGTYPATLDVIVAME